MCGIFGIISKSEVNHEHARHLSSRATSRGKDSSGILTYSKDIYRIYKADTSINALEKKVSLNNVCVFMGHSRLITNGLLDNQPVLKPNIAVFHNGIVLNDLDLWKKTKLKKELEIDTEIIAALVEDGISHNLDLVSIHDSIIRLCKGVIATAIALPKVGKLMLFSNNGSLYLGKIENSFYFSSEEFPLKELQCSDIKQIKHLELLDIPQIDRNFEIQNFPGRSENLIPPLILKSDEEKLLTYPKHNLKRCKKCILPETMPFIHFDKDGVCNYCHSYKKRNVPKPKEQLFELVEPYRKVSRQDCIVPFSGGRDSCYALHLILTELKMKPVTYTYDWGMVTDLGRRNISRMCSELGVENIIIADDISRKRKNIKMNLTAWLKSPHLGMMSILTAGDKHFFRHVETVKKQTDINLNLWGVNPLEVTHFKTGFLGIEPDFETKKVYTSGIMPQLRYQSKRLMAMLDSPGYFNSSLWDTLSGEYYRSFTSKNDYYHIFDYWRWDEKVINDTLDFYGWERAIDTKTTWRIGDGTAAFYNYVYYTVAGFTEHDTFRSNQIREGDITREEALALVQDENQPRYANIKWYLDAVGIDFKDAIAIINNIPKLYKDF